ncbi:MAG TPA: hypothetical protein VGK10_11425 [Prolixibacteraceae bacterium]
MPLTLFEKLTSEYLLFLSASQHEAFIVIELPPGTKWKKNGKLKAEKAVILYQ